MKQSMKHTIINIKKQILKVFYTLYNSINNFIFGNCVYCHTFIYKENDLCDLCEKNFINYKILKCIFCNLSRQCICINIQYNVLYKYNKYVSDIILRFKYNNEHNLSMFFAYKMLKFIQNDVVFLCIPTTRKKLIQRTYNQSAEICKQLSYLTHMKFDASVFIKTKTTSQQNASAAQRIQNATTIELNNISNIINKNVVIIDDVIASGATILRCINLLKPYVNNIHVIVIAKTS